MSVSNITARVEALRIEEMDRKFIVLEGKPYRRDDFEGDPRVGDYLLRRTSMYSQDTGLINYDIDYGTGYAFRKEHVTFERREGQCYIYVTESGTHIRASDKRGMLATVDVPCVLRNSDVYTLNPDFTSYTTAESVAESVPEVVSNEYTEIASKILKCMPPALRANYASDDTLAALEYAYDMFCGMRG